MAAPPTRKRVSRKTTFLVLGFISPLRVVASSARSSGAFAIIATFDLSTRDAKLKLMIVSNQTIAGHALFEYSLRTSKRANLRNAKYYNIVELRYSDHTW